MTMTSAASIHTADKDGRDVYGHFAGPYRRHVHRLVQPLRIPAAALLVNAGEGHRSIVRLSHNPDDAHLLWQTFSTNTRLKWDSAGELPQHGR